jgi:hypothetical protein
MAERSGDSESIAVVALAPDTPLTHGNDYFVRRCDAIACGTSWKTVPLRPLSRVEDRPEWNVVFRCRQRFTTAKTAVAILSKNLARRTFLSHMRPVY